MISISDKTKCAGCFACYNICPQKCIAMCEDEEGFNYPTVNEDNCIRCGLCENVCPIINNRRATKSETCSYGAATINDGIRKESSSGGIFTLIAKEILDNNGIVFGAAFTSDFYGVRHIGIDNVESIGKLRGSKYLQSEIGESFLNAKKYLEEGRSVLFCGTPCQIAGLRSFLDKDYDNLLTVDFFCHGVPSSLVWKNYLKKREAKARSRATGVSFRDKKTSWSRYYLSIKFANKTNYSKLGYEDLYMRGFISNLYLRPSCYDCNFKGFDTGSDITIADFWGVEKVLSWLDDKGTSIVIVNTLKGRNVFNKIADGMRFEKVELDKALQFNPSAEISATPHKNRDLFFDRINKKSIEKNISKSLGIGVFDIFHRLASKIKAKIKNIVKR